MMKKSKNDAKKKSAPTPHERETFVVAPRIDGRKELLARVAGSIAAGLVTTPSPSISKPDSMATVAVDIAEAILKQAGIPSAEPSVASAESSSPGRDVGVGAAS